jgi:hypothetical protein
VKANGNVSPHNFYVYVFNDVLLTRVGPLQGGIVHAQKKMTHTDTFTVPSCEAAKR